MAYKTCPECSKQSGVRTHRCQCGYDFAGGTNSKSRNTPVASKDVPRANLFNSSGRITTLIAIPAGECPEPLPKDPDIDSMRIWIEDIRKPFRKISQELLPSAIHYFARHQFIDVKDRKLKKIELLLDEILIPSEDKGVLES